jgi:hypothetical protein
VEKYYQLHIEKKYNSFIHICNDRVAQIGVLNFALAIEVLVLQPSGSEIVNL